MISTRSGPRAANPLATIVSLRPCIDGRPDLSARSAILLPLVYVSAPATMITALFPFCLRGGAMSSSSGDARLRTRNESKATRADRMLIMHPTYGVVRENSQSLSLVRSFVQGPGSLNACFSKRSPRPPHHCGRLAQWRTQLSRPRAHRNWTECGLRIFLRCGSF